MSEEVVASNEETWDTATRKPGSFAINWEVSDRFLNQLGWKGMSVYSSLCYHASKDEEPTVRELAVHGLSEKVVKRSLAMLIELGIATEIKGAKPRTPSKFELVDPGPNKRTSRAN
jgi:hypothetical protein